MEKLKQFARQPATYFKAIKHVPVYSGLDSAPLHTSTD